MTRLQNVLKKHLHERTQASKYFFVHITPEIKKQTASMSKEDLIIAFDNVINHILDDYTEFLVDNNYCDIDAYTEEPLVIDLYLQQDKPKSAR